MLLKITLLIVFGTIAIQDFQERAVLWFLFPILGVFLTFLFFKSTSAQQYFIGVVMNISLVSIILAILYLYTKFIAKKEFLNVSFGLGDLLFFYAFAIGYPTYTFLVLFVGSVLFSLMVFYIMNIKKQSETVPLAGLMSVFLMIVTMVSLLTSSPSLYSI